MSYDIGRGSTRGETRRMVEGNAGNGVRDEHEAGARGGPKTDRIR